MTSRTRDKSWSSQQVCFVYHTSPANPPFTGQVVIRLHPTLMAMSTRPTMLVSSRLAPFLVYGPEQVSNDAYLVPSHPPLLSPPSLLAHVSSRLIDNHEHTSNDARLVSSTSTRRSSGFVWPHLSPSTTAMSMHSRTLVLSLPGDKHGPR